MIPRDDRERKWVTFNTFVLHFRPVRVPEKTLRYTHTFGLGGMSLMLMLVLVGTGLLLMFGYEPAPGSAYQSLLRIEEATRFGGLLRSVHHWSANLLILVLTLHLLRVYFTGGFHSPRQFNWVLGLGLLACVLASNFTGYLLPWDQLSYWAITISTGMLGYVPWIGEGIQMAIRGGDEVGQATLITFYTLHTSIVPAFAIILMGFHFWRVRKAKGVVVPRAPGEAPSEEVERVLALPHLFLREFVVALVLLAGVLFFSAIFAAPLGEAANPGMSPNPAKAPWYFMGFQELLLHFHPVFAVVVLPLAGGLALISLPYLRYEDDPSGIWFVSERGRILAKWGALAGLVLTPILVALDEWVLDLPGLLPGVPPVVSNGLVPVGLLFLGSWAGYRWVRRSRSATRNEAVQAGFVFFGTVFLVLTAIGIWFRGSGMALGWAG
ncbi:MAG: cytochrome b N-terminal domain-containing protein [Longimicrobiales bacterium]